MFASPTAQLEVGIRQRPPQCARSSVLLNGKLPPNNRRFPISGNQYPKNELSAMWESSRSSSHINRNLDDQEGSMANGVFPPRLGLTDHAFSNPVSSNFSACAATTGRLK